MKWKVVIDKTGQMQRAVRTDCGRFTICKWTMDGKDLFILWDSRTPRGKWGELVDSGDYPTLALAKQAALDVVKSEPRQLPSTEHLDWMAA